MVWQTWQVPILFILIIIIGFFAGYTGYKVKAHLMKKEINNLSLTLDQMMQGVFIDDYSAYKEGDFGRLYNQLETVANRMKYSLARLKMEQSNMKDYIADISHELKTPITALMTYLDLLISKETDETDKMQLERCIVLAEKMNAIVKSLLDLARLEVNDLALSIEPHVLADTIDHVSSLVMKCGINENVTIINEVEQDITLRFDEQWMSQAIFNIMKNAALYCGGYPQIYVKAIQTDAIVILKIKDNGTGLGSEEIEHIFERFYRVKGNNGKSGLGLGLSIAKMIVEKHHGGIEVRSDADGTEFSIMMPTFHTVTRMKV
jgi:signal transduction histidine kinase